MMRHNETKKQKDRKTARDLGIEIGEKRDDSTSIRISQIRPTWRLRKYNGDRPIG